MKQLYDRRQGRGKGALAEPRRRGPNAAGGATSQERAYRLIRALAPGAAFAAGLGVVASSQPILAHFCWVLIPIAFRLAAMLLEPAKAPVSDREAEA